MIHINNFIDKIKVAEARTSTNFIMTMSEAKNLHADITKLLIALQELNTSERKTNDEIIKVEVNQENW